MKGAAQDNNEQPATMTYRKRHRPLPENPPPLVPLADCYSNRSEGRFGYLPFSWRTLQSRIKALGITVRKLGPASHCITRQDLLRLQNESVSVAPRALRGRAKQLADDAAKRRAQ